MKDGVERSRTKVFPILRPYRLTGDCKGGIRFVATNSGVDFFFGSSRICGKMHLDGNQTILVWHALASKRPYIRNMGPELEALVTFVAPHKSAMNLFPINRPSCSLCPSWLKINEFYHEGHKEHEYTPSPKFVAIRTIFITPAITALGPNPLTFSTS